jgi:hypothetical protein
MVLPSTLCSPLMLLGKNAIERFGRQDGGYRTVMTQQLLADFCFENSWGARDYMKYFIQAAGRATLQETCRHQARCISPRPAN